MNNPDLHQEPQAQPQEQPQAQENVQEQPQEAFDIKSLEAMAFGGNVNSAHINQEQQKTEKNIQNESEILKELGFASVNDIKSEIEALKQKANNKQDNNFEFANDESKKMFMLLKEGKTSDLLSYLESQEKISKLDDMDSDSKLKLFYKMQLGIDDDLVDLKMQREYGFDESKYIDEIDETVFDPKGYKLAKAEAEFKKNNDLEKAQSFFEQYKKKIELPDIGSFANEDKEYQEYKASTAESRKFFDEVSPKINALQIKDVPMNFSINDENNQMKFDVSIVPDEAAFNQAKQDSLALDVFKGCYDANGVFNPTKLQRLALFANNLDNYVQSIARQAVNAERRRVISDNTPSNVRRDYQVNVEPTELQMLEKIAFG